MPFMTEPDRPRAVLMFGATGTIGSFIIKALIQARRSGELERLGIFTSHDTIVNKGETIDILTANGVEVHIGNVSEEDALRGVLGRERHGVAFDTIVNAAGRNAILTQIPILEIAEQIPTVHRFFPSEYGTDIEYDAQTSPHERPHQHKLQVRQYIRDHIRRLSCTYLVTGPYSELWLGKPPGPAPMIGGFDVKAKKAVVAYDGKGRVSFTTMDDVGKLLVAALLHPEASRNRALKVNSFTTTPLEVVAEFERQMGGEKWQVDFTPREELLRGEADAISNNSPLATGFTLRRIWADGQTLYAERDNGRIGFEGQEGSLKEQVALAIRKQTA